MRELATVILFVVAMLCVALALLAGGDPQGRGTSTIVRCAGGTGACLLLIAAVWLI